MKANLAAYFFLSGACLVAAFFLLVFECFDASLISLSLTGLFLKLGFIEEKRFNKKNNIHTV